MAVTPDELGDLWHRGRLCAPVTVRVNGTWIGAPDASNMTFSFGDLIAHAAKTRRLSAGTIIGSIAQGTVNEHLNRLREGTTADADAARGRPEIGGSVETTS